MNFLRPWSTFAAAVLLASCSTQAGGTAIAPAQALPAVASDVAASNVATRIKHVVIIVQENRTFDNLFHGFPGAATATSGATHTGTRVTLHAGTFAGPDMWHDWRNAMTDWDGGKMDGFDRNLFVDNQPAGTYSYSYVKQSLVTPYWAMARQYVLADHMFPTMFGPSFTAHLDLIAGTTDLNPTQAEVDGPETQPWGCDAPPGTWTSYVNAQRVVSYEAGPFPCFTQFRTMADTLDAAHVSWKYYAPAVVAGSTGEIWSEFDAIRSVRYGPDWKRNVISPQTRVLSDAARGALPSVAWVIPDAQDSDHVGGPAQSLGPAWVASVVNAIGKGPDWSSTAIVVLWDDWGGWFDSVPPPQLDYRGLGIRVPCIIISPYAKAHYVSHTPYEFGSILRFVEEAFHLPPLGALSAGYTDARATSLGDSFDFTHPPRSFTPIPSDYGPSYFIARPPSMRVPDEQ